MLIYFIGALAAITSTISLFPQIYKTFKSKSAKDLSLLMLCNFFITSFLWVSYGLMIGSYAVWVTNIIMVISSIIMIFFKFRYKSSQALD